MAVKDIDTTDKFVQFLTDLFENSSNFYDVAVFPISRAEKINFSKEHRKYTIKRYICTFYRGAFGESPIHFQEESYVYLDSKYLETLIIGAISKSSFYHINWKKRKIIKRPEIMG